MQSNVHGWERPRQSVLILASVLWLACDGESARSAAALPAEPERSRVSSMQDAGATGPEGPMGTLPGDEPGGAGGMSSTPSGVDAGSRPEADAGGASMAGAGGIPFGNDCCTESALPGCSSAPVLECVCAGDAACCNESYDALCVTEAITRCALACEVPPPESDCLRPSQVPGCTLPDIAECVCTIDPFCCTFRFDANCVTLAAAQCIGAPSSGQGAPP
jgi:hypothetical protein